MSDRHADRQADRATDAVREHPRIAELGRTRREQMRVARFAEDLAWWLYTGQREGLGALARVVTVVAARELRDGQRVCNGRPLLSVEAAARATEQLWPWLRVPPRPLKQPEQEEPEPQPEPEPEPEPEPDDAEGDEPDHDKDSDDDSEEADPESGESEDEDEGEDDEGAEDEGEDDEGAEDLDEDGDEDGDQDSDQDGDEDGDQTGDAQPSDAGDEPGDPLDNLLALAGEDGADDEELNALAGRLAGLANPEVGAGQLLGQPAGAALDGAMDAARGLGHLERFLPGVGWSIAPGQVQQLALSRLDQFVALLDRLPELEAIAEALGRLEDADRREGTTDGGSEEVVGVHLSGEVRHALPSELGLLGDPATEDLFYTRWAEHRLVSLELAGAGLEGAGEGTTRGPVIVCLDASASMDGAPELASKALVLALCRRVLPQNRAVHVLMFGGRGQHLEVRLRRGRGALEALLDLLVQTFDGGTDFDGPLLKALDMLEDQELERADILVVTDGHAVTTPFVDHRVQQVRDRLGLTVMTVILGAGPLDGVEGFSDEVWRLAPKRLDGALGLLRNVQRR